MKSHATRTFLAVTGTLASLACGQSGNPIVLGLSGPFSEPAGRSMRLGAELAVAEINDRGGVRGRTLSLLPLDDRGQPATAVQMARRFLDDSDVLAVLGHPQSATTVAAAPVYGSGTITVAAVSPSASSVDLNRAGATVFRVCPDDLAHADALAEVAREQLGIRRVVTLYRNDRDSRTSAAAFSRAFTERGGTVLSEDPFSPALPSFEPYLTRAAARGRLDGLLIIGGEGAVEEILAALDSVNANPTILGRVDLLRFAQSAGVDLDGALLSAAYFPNRRDAVNEAFVNAYLQAHGGQQPDYIAAGAYDIVRLIARAIERRGATREGIRSYLARLGTDEEPFRGATGPIAFDRHGNLQSTIVEVGIVRDGHVVPILERR